MFNTAWYALIGAILGPAICVAVFGFTALAVAIADRATAGSTPLLVGVGVLAGLFFLAAAFFVLRASSYGTCKRHPTAPAGIAAGIALGLLFVAAFVAYGAAWRFPAGIALAALFGFAGYQGGTRALRESLGPSRRGVGNLCAHCGYDLSATAEGLVCPECGGTLRYDKKA